MERIVEITYSSSESEQTVQVREENVSSILHGLNHMDCRLVGIKNVEEKGLYFDSVVQAKFRDMLNSYSKVVTETNVGMMIGSDVVKVGAVNDFISELIKESKGEE